MNNILRIVHYTPNSHEHTGHIQVKNFLVLNILQKWKNILSGVKYLHKNHIRLIFAL